MFGLRCLIAIPKESNDDDTTHKPAPSDTHTFRRDCPCSRVLALADIIVLGAVGGSSSCQGGISKYQSVITCLPLLED
jgi:hypothetical protein